MSIDSEKALWSAYVVRMIKDAINPFKVTEGFDKGELDHQYNTFRMFYSRNGLSFAEKGALRSMSNGYNNLTSTKSRQFFESSSFDEIAEDLELGDVFVSKVFDYVQYAITLEDQLFNEFERKAA